MITRRDCICDTYEYGSGSEVPKPNPNCRWCSPRHPAPYTPTTPDPARLTLGEP